MRKKDLLAGLYNVYAVYDKISKHYKSMHFASNDEDFIRLFLPTLILSTPLRELQIFKIGIFNDVTGELKPTVRKRINTSCYLFPHSKLSPEGENLTHEEIEEELIKTKNQIIAETTTVEEGDEAHE